jgi:hypothetical protein
MFRSTGGEEFRKSSDMSRTSDPDQTRLPTGLLTKTRVVARTTATKDSHDHDAACSDAGRGGRADTRNTDPDQRWQVTRPETSSSTAVWVRTPFVTNYGYSHYQLGRPGPRSSLQTTDPTGTTHSVMS